MSVPVRCSRCQVLMSRQGDNYVCGECGRTMSVQRCEEVAGRPLTSTAPTQEDQ